MNRCRIPAFIALLCLFSRMMSAQTGESPVKLDPYEVTGYLENYASGSAFSALRVNAPLMEIPLSTSIITGGLLRDQGVTDVNDAIRNISGAQKVEGGSEFQNYYFTRGMPNFYYRDGIRMELAGGNITPNVSGIENIEVIKGPSSILYGLGTPGGIVNFNSKRPLFSRRQSWSVSAGSEDYLRADLDVTGSASRQFAYRLTAAAEDAGSHRDGVNSTTYYLTPSALMNFGKDSQLLLLVDAADQKLTPDGGIATRPDGRLPSWAGEGVNFARSFNTVSPRRAEVDFDSVRYFTELNTKLSPDHELRLMASHMRFDNNRSEMAMNMVDSAASGIPGMLGPDQLLRTWLSKSGERELSVVRLEHISRFARQLGNATLEHQVLLSLHFGRTVTEMTSSSQDHEIVDLNTRLATPVWQYFAMFGLGTTRDGQLIYDNGSDRTTSRDLAVAVQDNIKISDSWRLLVGLRYEENKAELRSARENFLFGATPAPIATQIDSEATKGRLLPRVGLLFKARPNLSLFGNYLTSFIPAGSTQLGKDGLIDPETGDQVEVGAKVEFMEGRLFATASLFKIRRKGIATTYIDMTTFTNYWKASDTEESSGMELELTGVIAPGLNVVGHLGYLDNEFTGTDIAAKIGRRRHALSEVTASVWGVHTVSAGRLSGLRLGLGAFHSGPQYLEDYNTVEVGSRTLCDAMVAYGRQRWDVQLNVRNLFDRRYNHPSGNGYNDPAYSPANYNAAVQTVTPGSGVEIRLRVGYAF